MDPLIEAYLGIYEAKVDAGSPLEKEDIRNKREFGTESGRNKKTGLRRFFHGVSRGVKKDTPSGNEPSQISGRFGTGAEVRREIRKLKARKQGRDIAKQSKMEREAREYVKKANSQFAADSAENKIVKFNREELEYILDVLVSEGFAVDYDGAVFILEAMSDEWVDCILDEKHVKAMDFKGRGPDRRTRFRQFYGRDGEFTPKFVRRRARVNDKRIDPYFTGKRERKTERRQGVGGFREELDRILQEAPFDVYRGSTEYDGMKVGEREPVKVNKRPYKTKMGVSDALKNAGAKPGDFGVGEPYGAMPHENPEKGKKLRAKLYSKDYGANLDKRTGKMVSRVR